MISQLKNHITEKQLNRIVEIIVKQYADYNRLTNSQSFRSVFSDEYAPHNRQFSVSWAIASGFPSQTDACEGFQIKCLNYSRSFTRPLLISETMKILVLNKTTHFNAHYLDEFYEMNNTLNGNQQLFAYFKFSVEKKQLTRISICFPDKKGRVIAEEIILNREQIKRIAA